MPDVARETRDHPPKRLMGYYDICQAPLFLAAKGKRLVHLIYPFVGKPWPINHCQHLSGLLPPGVGNGFALHHYDITFLIHAYLK